MLWTLKRKLHVGHVYNAHLLELSALIPEIIHSIPETTEDDSHGAAVVSLCYKT